MRLAKRSISLEQEGVFMPVFNSRYDVLRPLGAGRFGTVYACRHLEMSGHVVAVKILHPELGKDEACVKQFRDEVTTSFSVSHPHVVRAYEYFRDKDVTGFTMEYVDGGNLAQRLIGERQIPIREVVRLLSEICGGLQSIHDANLVHGNLTAENVLVTSRNEVKLSDFGQSQLPKSPKTEEAEAVGGRGVDASSPEFLESGISDESSDFYAVGIIGYRLVTGIPPFTIESPTESLRRRKSESYIPPEELRKECPRRLNDWVAQALRADRTRRFRSPTEMRLMLEEIIRMDLLH